jgi:uncharacterized repeat protein (TIGR03847 family)
MEPATHDFGEAVSVDAEAIGQPGQRRFRLMVRSANQTAAIWMEKEQLEGIGVWIQEVVDKLSEEQSAGQPDVDPTPFDEAFDVEMRASQIGLGYAEEEQRFAIHAFDAEALTTDPAFRCWLTLGQSRVLSRKIAEVVAGGRPICPLCSLPIDPTGHVCPRSNGHSTLAV